MGRLRQLRERMNRAGLKPSSRRGQNFLLDNNQLRFIADLGGLTHRDVILEVGPGCGFLTRELALSGGLVLAVELDRGLLPLAMEETSGLPNVFYLQGDILAGKNAVNPAVPERLAELLALKRKALSDAGEPGEPALKCVSNLPYSAGTPFVMNLLSSPLPWEIGVFLLQKEVAERICAAAGSGAYGSLSIGCGLAAASSIERIVPPRSFWPAPNVDSAVVAMRFRPLPERAAVPWRGLRRITSAVFGSRRKNLKNALKGVFDKDAVQPALDAAGVSPGERGENMSPEQFRILAERLEQAGQGRAAGN